VLYCGHVTMDRLQWINDEMVVVDSMQYKHDERRTEQHRIFSLKEKNPRVFGRTSSDV
jgi:hypothetical protein